MYCDFVDYKWSGWYCRKEGMTVSKSTVNEYCDNSLNWKNCPVYKKSSGNGCYLTTVMCEVLGKDDKCTELETLRNFRDSYMKKDEKYTDILVDYDLIGPILSDKILDDENCENIAHSMKSYYIDDAIEAIREEQFEDAIDIYMDMTLNLMEHYDIDTRILKADNYDKSKSKTKIRKK